MQLPVYVPNDEEKKDPEKFATNVRKYMVRPLFCPALSISVSTLSPWPSAGLRTLVLILFKLMPTLHLTLIACLYISHLHNGSSHPVHGVTAHGMHSGGLPSLLASVPGALLGCKGDDNAKYCALQMQYSKFIDSSATFDDKRVYHARLKGLPPPEVTLRKKAR